MGRKRTLVGALIAIYELPAFDLSVAAKWRLLGGAVPLRERPSYVRGHRRSVRWPSHTQTLAIFLTAARLPGVRVTKLTDRFAETATRFATAISLALSRFHCGQSRQVAWFGAARGGQ